MRFLLSSSAGTRAALTRWPTSGHQCPTSRDRQWCCPESHIEYLVPKPQDSRTRRVQARVFCTTADGSTVENEGEKTLIIFTADGTQLRKSGQRQRGTQSRRRQGLGTEWCSIRQYPTIEKVTTIWEAGGVAWPAISNNPTERI